MASEHLEDLFWDLLEQLPRTATCAQACDGPDVKFGLHSARGYVSVMCNGCRHSEVATTKEELRSMLGRWHGG